MASIPGVNLPPAVEAYAPGLLWLATYAQLQGIETRIVTFDQILKDGIPKDCCIGFTATAPDVPGVLTMVEQLRDVAPETMFALGGAHVQACSPREADRLLAAGINVIDKGNGSALIALLQGRPPGAGGVLGLQLDSPWPSLLPGIRKPDYDLLGDRLMRSVPNTFTALGCNGRCVYCSSSGTRRVQRHLASVVEELEDLGNRLPEGRLVHFTDCDFLADPSRVERLLPQLPRSLRYSCDCNVASARADVLRVMWASGFVRINLGIEDPHCNRTWLRMRELPNLFHQLRSIRMAFPGVIRGYFLVGLPGSRLNSIKPFLDSMRELLDSRIIDVATVKALVPYPGTFLHSHAKEFGLTILTRELKHYMRLDHPVYELDGLPAETIEQWLIEALLIAREAYVKRVADDHLDSSSPTSCNYTRGQVCRGMPD